MLNLISIQTKKELKMTLKNSLRFEATLLKNGISSKAIPTKLIYGESQYDQPCIELYPESINYHQVACNLGSSKLIDKNIFDKEGEPHLIIEAENMMLGENSSNGFPGENFVKTKPLKITIKNKIKHSNISINELIFRFHITKNSFLNRDIIYSFDERGIVNIEPNKKLVIEANNLILEFDFYYRSNIFGGKITQEIAHFIEIKTNPIASLEEKGEELCRLIDDILLIASYATSKHTVCYMWEVISTDWHVTRHRGDRVMPDLNDRGTVTSERRNHNDLPSFISKAYNKLKKPSFDHSLKLAFNHLVTPSSNSIEMNYLQAFTCIESLILSHSRTDGKEFIIPKGAKWNSLKGKIKKAIKNYYTENEPDEKRKERSEIYNKLNGLHRKSLEVAYNDFISNYKINTDGLTPLSSNKVESLSSLRNKLVHGEPYDENTIEKIIYFQRHLEILIERSIDAIISRSNFQYAIVEDRNRLP